MPTKAKPARFSARLRELRAAAGWSQEGLAAKAGVPVGTLRNLEQGIREPRVSTAIALAGALGVSLDALCR